MESADQYFRLICECQVKWVPSETAQVCPACSKRHVDMAFEIDPFLARVYELCESDKRSSALDLVFDAYFQFGDRFDIMTRIYDKLDWTRLTTSLIRGFLTMTFKYSSRLPAHALAYTKAVEEFRRRGETEERTKNVLGGVEGEGTYWQDMKSLGATGLVWGVPPIR